MTSETLKLEARLYGRPVLVFETGLGRSRDLYGIEPGPNAWQLTGAWLPHTPLTGAAIDRWLTGLRPQNGARSAQRRRAVTRLAALNIERRYDDQGDIVWATPGFEYPGAVSFRSLRANGSELAPDPTPMQAMSERTVERLLAQVVLEMRRGVIDPAALGVQPVTSSGSLPKFAVHQGIDDGAWYLPSRDRLSTHIVKQEERGDLPGEAAVESVCQRTLRHLGIRAARTRATVIGGRQVIVSERGDRRFNPESGLIEPIHQEEWASACGLDPDEILQRPGAPGGWKDLRAFLRERGGNTEGEIDHFWTSLAAVTLLGHRDLHRRNVGIRYGREDEPASCELAPWYDVASLDGQRNDIWCSMGMLTGGSDDVATLAENEWVRQARECDDDPGQVLGLLADVARRLPTALERAIEDARTQDEWRDPQQAETRLAALREGAGRRAQRAQAPTRHLRHTPREPNWLGPTLDAMEAKETVTLIVGASDRSLNIRVTDAAGGTRLVGEVANVSRYVNALRRAKVVDPDETPYLERSLERERRIELERARTRGIERG